jgi:hypothetical protein
MSCCITRELGGFTFTGLAACVDLGFPSAFPLAGLHSRHYSRVFEQTNHEKTTHEKTP